MSQPPKLRVLTYHEVVDLFEDDAFVDGLKDSFKSAAESLLNLMEAFRNVSAQLHSLDIQSQAPPWKPNWDSICSDFSDIIWQSRTNAGLVSGRLRMFCTVILPLVSRTGDEASSRSQVEKFQILQSFMNITADNSSLAWGLTSSAMKLLANLNSFHTEFCKFASRQTSPGRRELQDLTQTLSDLETTVKQLYFTTGKLIDPHVNHFAYCALRVVAASNRRGNRIKVSHHQLSLANCKLSNIANLYEQLDRTRNEVAHKDYAAQIANRRTDVVSTTRSTISTLVPDSIITLETCLSTFLCTWTRLQNDSFQILKWLRGTESSLDMPPCVAAFRNNDSTLFTALAASLEAYVTIIDPSLFPGRQS